MELGNRDRKTKKSENQKIRKLETRKVITPNMYILAPILLYRFGQGGQKYQAFIPKDLRNRLLYVQCFIII